MTPLWSLLDSGYLYVGSHLHCGLVCLFLRDLLAEYLVFHAKQLPSEYLKFFFRKIYSESWWLHLTSALRLTAIYLVHAASVQPFLCELMMRTRFYLNLLVLHFQRRVTDIDCDIFPQFLLLAGHTFTFLVIYCAVTHIFS